MSKVKKGLAGEHIAKAIFLLNEYNIYEEVNYDSKCDLIVEKNNLYFRIQIKILDNHKKLNFRKLTHSKNNHKQYHYTDKDVDFFVGVDINTFDLYIIPIKEINKSSMNISRMEKYKNNFNLERCCRNAINEFPQFGESFDNANAELALKNASVETLRETS